MDFICFECPQKFGDLNAGIKHLKDIHHLKDNTSKIKCLVFGCDRDYFSFKAMRNHAVSCVKKRQSLQTESLIPVRLNEFDDNSMSTEKNNGQNVEALKSDFDDKEGEFNFNYVPLRTFASKDDGVEIEWIKHNCNETTAGRKISDSFDETDEFLKSFEDQINELLLSQKEANKVFELCGRMVDHIHKLNLILINNSTRMNATQALDTANNFVKIKLSKFNTVYKRNRKYDSNPLFVSPQEKAVGTRWEMILDKENSKSTPRLIQSSFQYVSIIETIRSLFLREDFIRAFQNNNIDKNHLCKSGEYTDFCCGSVFKNNELYQKHPNSLQIQIATDDFEICNPLSSKASVHKICAVYFVIRNMPNLSNVKNINLICLCNSNDLKSKQTDFNNLWKIIVDEIKYLEETGINVNDSLNVKGTLVNVSFDNLGGNCCFGFVECFNATYYCRICELSNEECQMMCEEREGKRRTMEGYNNYMTVIENSSKVDYKESYGLKRYCVLNDLKYFHIMKNQSVDIMHDLNEGAIPFVLRYLFKNCLAKKLFDDENTLVKTLQYFDYGYLKKKNVPSHLCMEKHNLNQTAAQSLVLFQHVPFILFQHREKLQDIWICIQSLLKIVQIVYSLKLTEKDLQNLELCVSDFLKNMKLKFNVNFTPKLHFMTHYASIIREMGPLKHMSMMRFESKHKTFKDFGKKTNNFVNVNKSLAIKHQQLMSRCGMSYDQEISYGKRGVRPNVNFLLNIANVSEHDVICELKWIQYNSHRFRAGQLIVHNTLLYEIEQLMTVNNECYMLCFQYDRVSFDSFLNSLKITKIEPTQFEFIKFDSLQKKIIHEKKVLNDEYYVIADSLDLHLN